MGEAQTWQDVALVALNVVQTLVLAYLAGVGAVRNVRQRNGNGSLERERFTE